VTEAARAFVRQRAANRCEYCHLHQDDSPLAALHIEHIRPRKHGGSDDESNLCLACIDCNLHKGSNLTGIDPLTGALTELFHPRQQRWEDHFAFEGIYIVGKSALGRTTIRVLDMNSDDQLNLRATG
jgi:5-methylcytosine-specific restriction endonuclease McrA